MPFAPKKRPGRERREHPVQERYHHQQQRGRDDGGRSGVVPIEGIVDGALLDRGGKRSQTQSSVQWLISCTSIPESDPKKWSNSETGTRASNMQVVAAGAHWSL